MSRWVTQNRSEYEFRVTAEVFQVGEYWHGYVSANDYHKTITRCATRAAAEATCSNLIWERLQQEMAALSLLYPEGTAKVQREGKTP